MYTNLAVTLSRQILWLFFASLSWFTNSMVLAESNISGTNTSILFAITTTSSQEGDIARVDPILLVGKERFLTIYEACQKRSDDQKDKLAGHSERIEKFLDSYCSNNKTILDTSNLTISNNTGDGIMLSNLSFQPNLKDKKRHIPPILPLSGKGEIVRYLEDSKNNNKLIGSTVESNRYYIGVLGGNKITEFVPSVTVESETLRKLVNRAYVLSKEKTGLIKHRVDSKKELGPSSLLATKRTELFSPIFSDFDRDGKVDLVIGIKSNLKGTKSEGPGSYVYVWSGLAFLYGNGKDQYISSNQKYYDYVSGLARGSETLMPRSYLNLFGCNYLLYRENLVYEQDYYLMSFNNNKCGNKIIIKYREKTMQTDSR